MISSIIIGITTTAVHFRIPWPRLVRDSAPLSQDITPAEAMNIWGGFPASIPAL